MGEHKQRNGAGKAREAVLKSTDGNLPPVLDPFCAGRSIPLEAQPVGRGRRYLERFRAKPTHG